MIGRMVVFLVHLADEVDAARGLAWRLRWHDCTPTAVWTSPHDHAVMTATNLVEILEWDGPIETRSALGPGQTDPAPLVAALAAVAALAPDAAVVVIGHEPMLSQLGRRLTGLAVLPALAAGEALRLDDGALRWRFAHDGDAPIRDHEPPR